MTTPKTLTVTCEADFDACRYWSERRKDGHPLRSVGHAMADAYDKWEAENKPRYEVEQTMGWCRVLHRVSGVEVAEFGPRYPGGPEAAARAEAARPNEGGRG